MIAAFLLRYWLQLLAVAAVVAGVWWGVHAFHERDLRLIEQGRQEVQAKWDADAERRRQQVTALALLWDKARQRADEEARKREQQTSSTFDSIKVDRVASVPIVLPADVVGVLRESSRAANGSDQGPPVVGLDATPAVAVSGVPEAFDAREVAQFGKDAARAYADARNQWLSCVREYDAITPAQ